MGYIPNFKKCVIIYDISYKGVIVLTCTFFGHSDAPSTICPIIKETVIKLIKDYNVKNFYVGNNGNFDRFVIGVLRQIKEEFPQISFAVVLAYMPKEKQSFLFNETLYPDGLEEVPPKFAIIKRNEWMLNKADYVVVYVNRVFGGAAKFKEKAEKSGKTVINLAMR